MTIRAGNLFEIKTRLHSSGSPANGSAAWRALNPPVCGNCGGWFWHAD